MAKKYIDYREASRQNYGKNIEEGESESLNRDQLTFGAILRIADATEKMAKNHTELIRERDMYERWYRQGEEENASLKKSNSALRGQITRFKKRVAELSSLINPKTSK